MDVDREIEKLERYLQHLKGINESGVFLKVAEAQLKNLKKQKNANTKDKF